MKGYAPSQVMQHWFLQFGEYKPASMLVEIGSAITQPAHQSGVLSYKKLRVVSNLLSVNSRTKQDEMIRRACVVTFCFLVFLFALRAKTAVYHSGAQGKITPSTASKLWVSAEKSEARGVAFPSVLPPWLTFLSLFGLYLLPKRRCFQDALVTHPPSNLRLRHLRRFLRPPPPHRS